MGFEGYMFNQSMADLLEYVVGPTDLSNIRERR
jgi:hypothetical protein